MYWNRIEANWNQLKGSVKDRWARLSDEQLLRINGRRDLLLQSIGASYDVTGNAAAVPRVLASSALLASDRSASAIDCRLPAAQQAGPTGPADSAQAIGAASCGAGGDAADVAAYMRLHRQTRTAIPFEWRPLGHCVSP